MVTKDDTTTNKIPFGAMEAPAGSRPGSGAAKSRRRKPKQESETDTSPSKGRGDAEGNDSKGNDGDQQKGARRGNTRRGGRRRRKRKPEDGEGAEQGNPRRERSSSEDAGSATESAQENSEGGPRRRRRRGRPRSNRGGGRTQDRTQDRPQEQDQGSEKSNEKAEIKTGKGMFLAEKGGYGTLRDLERQYLPSKQDIFVPQRLVQRCKLRDGSIIEGTVRKGKKYKFELDTVTSVDGEDPKKYAQLRTFKSLTTIDPDFHYAVGDVTGEVSMRILDLIAPIGRGQRGLIVAQPRTGKTTLMRQFADGIEKGFPEVHLMVLLVDERPEEATEWIRSTGGQVFVSTSDESPKNHVKLAEAVWKRCQRLVELGEDVVLIMDSLTRLARAYNNSAGGSGRTMSGGLDSRAMERPRQIFGSARNTETAGSLTILGTALIDTGSRMDQLIFEEFKGTGNMEVMLNRKLSDRRVFPAIDIEKSGTRKEEKLVSSRRLKRINTLRRVLLRMNFIEAMELLSDKLMDVEKTEDFLKRFDVDPEA